MTGEERQGSHSEATNLSENGNGENKSFDIREHDLEETSASELGRLIAKELAIHRDKIEDQEARLNALESQVESLVKELGDVEKQAIKDIRKQEHISRLDSYPNKQVEEFHKKIVNEKKYLTRHDIKRIFGLKSAKAQLDLMRDIAETEELFHYVKTDNPNEPDRLYHEKHYQTLKEKNEKEQRNQLGRIL